MITRDHILCDDANQINQTLAAEARKRGADTLARLLDAAADIANEMTEGDDEHRTEVLAAAALLDLEVAINAELYLEGLLEIPNGQ